MVVLFFFNINELGSGSIISLILFWEDLSHLLFLSDYSFTHFFLILRLCPIQAIQETASPFFSLEIPLSLPFPSVSGLLATDPVPHPPPLSLSLALTLAGGYANSSLSFLNWLIEARALWRPCLWAALFLSLSPLTTCVLVPSASRGYIYCNEPFTHLVRQ